MRLCIPDSVNKKHTPQSMRPISRIKYTNNRIILRSVTCLSVQAPFAVGKFEGVPHSGTQKAGASRNRLVHKEARRGGGAPIKMPILPEHVRVRFSSNPDFGIYETGLDRSARSGGHVGFVYSVVLDGYKPIRKYSIDAGTNECAHARTNACTLTGKHARMHTPTDT